MNEHINNSEKRKEALKRILRQLHEGKSVEEVKDDFATLLEGTTADEIAAAEQELIQEGLPAEEIQRLCDVHVAVFRESLDEQEQQETVPGHPIFTYRAENLAARRILDGLQERLEGLKEQPRGEGALEEAREQLAKLREYDKHYLRKENILFPYLERHGFTGPSSVMWGIHDEIREGWKRLARLLEVGPGDDVQAFVEGLEAYFEPMAHAVREMFYKEENILYPAAVERLTEEEWQAVRAQGPEIGYAYVRPGRKWQPGRESVTGEAKIIAEEETMEAKELVQLEVGKLTPEQINLMLKNLVVDVTFVDENDEVVYFSDTPDRTFTRTPSIIGRKVQNCHPPDSVDKVMEIVEAFRAGTHDSAEFWIELSGQFIHIRYFALRDEEGNYKGVIEVTQDVTHIRQLEGERRLVNWGVKSK